MEQSMKDDFTKQMISMLFERELTIIILICNTTKSWISVIFLPEMLFLSLSSLKHGVMVRALACGAEDPPIEITFDQMSGKLSLFTQQQMGTWLSSELGKV